MITPIPIEDFDEQTNTGKLYGTFCVAEVLPSGLERYIVISLLQRCFPHWHLYGLDDDDGDDDDDDEEDRIHK